ncbi:MAG: hypothetical protein ABFS43_08755 [Thermodesulfobacteriota bacterium]
MKQVPSKCVILAVLPILFMISACAGYGKLSSLPRNETDDLLADLLAQTDRYVVHYHGNSENIVSGVLFDPKDDGKHILPEGMLWKEVSDPETIASIIIAIQESYLPGYLPRLFSINAPRGESYGYLFTGWSYLVIRPLDEQTLRVYGLKGPPEYENVYPGGH